MNKDNIGGIGSQYGKRFLENFYNRLSEAGLLDNFKRLDGISQHILEFFAYFSATKVGETLDQGGIFQKIMGEVLKDAPSELFKRIYNNQHPSSHPADTPKNGDGFFSDLMDLEKKEMLAIIKTLGALEGEKKKKMFKKIQELSKERLSKFAGLSPGEKKKLSDFIDDAAPDGFLKKFNSSLKEFNDELETRIKKW